MELLSDVDCAAVGHSLGKALQEIMFHIKAALDGTLEEPEPMNQLFGKHLRDLEGHSPK